MNKINTWAETYSTYDYRSIVEEQEFLTEKKMKLKAEIEEIEIRIGAAESHECELVRECRKEVIEEYRNARKADRLIGEASLQMASMMPVSIEMGESVGV